MSATRSDVPRRLVLALPPDGASREGLRAAAGMADLIGAELLALFLEDERLLSAAAYVFPTGSAPGGAPPRMIEAARLEQELRRAALRMERRLRELTARARFAARFERLRGPMETALAERLEPLDVLVLFEPAEAGARVFGGHAAIITAASRERSVLSLPWRPAEAREGVVAVATPDPAHAASLIALAARIAGQAGARLEVWTPGGRPPAADGPGAAATLRNLDAPQAGREIRALLAGRTRLLLLDAAPHPALDALRALARRTGTPILSVPAGDERG